MLTTPEPERPRRASKRLVAIWNSCTASCETFCTAPPTTSSFVSAPSTVTLPPRPNWPADEMTTVLVFVGSKFGAGALPGVSSASSRKLRPLSGRFSISLWSMMRSTLEDSTSMSGRAPSRMTVSETLPTLRLTSSGALWPTRSGTGDSGVQAANPCASTLTSYSPGGRFGNVYAPSSFVFVSRAAPVATLVARTDAPVTNAPLGSVTTPRRVADADCAATADVESKSAAQTASAAADCRIFFLIGVRLFSERKARGRA